MKMPFCYCKLFRSAVAGAFSPASRLRDQRGFALILALSMLVLLSIIGVMALSNSTTEIGIAGNYRGGERALVAADRSLDYGMAVAPTTYSAALASPGTSVDLYSGTSSNGITSLTNSPVNVSDGNGIVSGLYPVANQSTLTYLGSGMAPAGSGSDATVDSGFKALYYVIKVRGAYPATASNPSISTLESEFAQIVPN